MKTTTEKTELRLRMRTLRNCLTEEQRTVASFSVTSALVRLPVLADCTAIAATLPVNGEIDLSEFCQWWLDLDRVLCIPKVAGDELVMYRVRDLIECHPGYKGCPEPAQTEIIHQIDAMLLPGLAFDESGNRLGQGGGHFDRYLRPLPESTIRVGVCYSLQLMAKLPYEEHDERVDWVVTPSRVLHIQR